jgi:hypothetical protein
MAVNGTERIVKGLPFIPAYSSTMVKDKRKTGKSVVLPGYRELAYHCMPIIKEGSYGVRKNIKI